MGSKINGSVVCENSFKNFLARRMIIQWDLAFHLNLNNEMIWMLSFSSKNIFKNFYLKT